MNKEVEVEPGETVLDAALDNDIDLNHQCGGNCVCSSCHIVVEQGLAGLNEPDEDELEMLEDVYDLTDSSRLSCQCIIAADLTVRIPSD
jgi:2Fe-2S ferredoxin